VELTVEFGRFGGNMILELHIDLEGVNLIVQSSRN
jgi:hypothetical protein